MFSVTDCRCGEASELANGVILDIFSRACCDLLLFQKHLKLYIKLQIAKVIYSRLTAAPVVLDKAANTH